MCNYFFYPNFINDHWRIEGEIFYGDKNHFVDLEHKSFRLDDIVSFAEAKGIGFYDTATAIKRHKDNASDKFLEVIESTDINGLLAEIPQCNLIVTTGEKATLTICEYFNVRDIPKVGNRVAIECKALNRSINLYRLPSSSRAYPLSLNKKAALYQKMFEYVGLL